MRPPSREELDRAVKRMTSALAEWGAERVIVHGSVARGDFTGVSDIDLIVVRDTDLDYLDRGRVALGLCWDQHPPVPVEVVVYTSEEYERLLEQKNPFLEEALRHGEVVHPR